MSMKTKKNENIKQNTMDVKFASTEKYAVSNIVAPVEKKNGNVMDWGDKNQYPNYVFSLYEETPTLHSIINGIVTYTVGEGVEEDNKMFTKEELTELVYDMALSYAIYGGIAIEVLRNQYGDVGEINILDMREVRSDEYNKVFYVSPDYKKKKAYGFQQYVIPKFEINDKETPRSIYFYKNNKFSTYPKPLFSASINSAECERSISQFNLNSIKNGFSSNVMIQFFGSVDDNTKNSIENSFGEKYCSEDNAARPTLLFLDNTENAAKIDKLDVNSFADRYSALNDRVRQDLFTPFRANPNLMGIATEGTGFAGEEYEMSFKLFNRMTIKPIQNIIKRIIKNILDIEIEIIPFNLD